MEKVSAWERAGDGLWAGLEEDASGRLRKGDAPSLESGRRKRVREVVDDDGSVAARSFLRFMMVALDASWAAGLSDNMRPTRLQAACDGASHLIRDYLATNPLCSAAVVCCRDGGAEVLSTLSSSERTHRGAIDTTRKQSPSGSFSVEAALSACVSALSGTPDYGSREIVLIVSALATSDAGDVVAKSAEVANRGIRISVVSLAAETRVLKKISTDTRGTFGVALDKTHLLELLATHVPPPPKPADPSQAQRYKERPPLVRMGFPSMRLDALATKLAVADGGLTVWTNRAYTCPTCKTRVPKLPTKCPACALPLVSSAHLAASYHHLFPVRNFREIKLEASNDLCFGCNHPLRPAPVDNGQEEDPSVFMYECPNCNQNFCATCDDFIHVNLHNCPGCKSVHENSLSSARRQSKASISVQGRSA